MSYVAQLTGGHPNSLGNTVTVVADVLAHPDRLEDLYACYFADDPVVRLRTSSALKRTAANRPALLIPFLGRLLADVPKIDQASAQWTLAQIVLAYTDKLTIAQLASAKEVILRNLVTYDDWIVRIQSATTLTAWAKSDEGLHDWLIPRLLAMETDRRKSVSRRATKLLSELLSNQ